MVFDVVDDVPELRELAGVSGGVAVEPDAEPDFHVDVEAVDGVEDHFGLVAVVAVEADFVGEFRHDGEVARDVVLGGDPFEAWGG